MSETQSIPVSLRRRTDPDGSALVAALHDRVDGEVRFDDGTRAAYSTDASNFRQVPIGVVIPAPSRPASRPWRSVANTVHRFSRAAAARALQASARTPRS